MDASPSVCNATCQDELAHELNGELSSVLLPVTVFVGVEGVLGLLCSILILYIYKARYHTSSFRYFVLFLAAHDLMACLTTVPGEIITQRSWYVYQFPIVCKVKSFFNVFTWASPALLLVVVAFDRYLSMCRPNGWLIRPKIALILCLACCLTAFLVSFPVAIFWGTRSYTKVYRDTNITVTICEKDHRFETTKRPHAYSVSIQVFDCVLMSLMTLVYLAIARNMYKESDRTSVAPVIQRHRNSSFENQSLLPPEGETTSADENTPIYQSNEGDSRPKSSVENTNSGTGHAENGQSRRQATRERIVTRLRHQRVLGQSVRRRTLIMFLLTAIFVVTSILYLTLLSGIARADDILERMTDGQRAVYFFFFRLYFINHVINPIIYGFLDPECRLVIKGFFC